MQDRPAPGVEKFGSLRDRARTQIITYWFLNEDKRLAKLLFQARADLEEKLAELPSPDQKPN